MFRKVTINYSNNEDQGVFVIEEEDEYISVDMEGVFVCVQYDGGVRWIHSDLIGSIVAENIEEE